MLFRKHLDVKKQKTETLTNEDENCYTKEINIVNKRSYKSNFK